MSKKNPSEFNAAKQLYAEQFDDAIVTNTYLKIALLAVSVIAVLLVTLNYSTLKVVRNFKPLVVRINDIGRAEAIKYDTFAYKPQEAEIKYFLSEFCRLYYGRNRSTLRDNFHKSLLFMDAPLGTSVEDAWRKNRTIEDFLAAQQPEVDIDVQKVAIEDLRAAPYRASVDYYAIYYNGVDRSEARRVLYTAHFVFLFQDSVLNELIQVNPLGLAVTYFREDAAFK